MTEQLKRLLCPFDDEIYCVFIKHKNNYDYVFTVDDINEEFLKFNYSEKLTKR